MPRSWGMKPLATAVDVAAAFKKFDSSADNLHLKDQWCNVAISKSGGKTTCTFASESKGEYAAILYCNTIEEWFYASKAAVNVTAADNGGKPVTLTLTYKKAIDDVAQNSVVLSICGKLAEHMAVPYARVTDQYGGSSVFHLLLFQVLLPLLQLPLLLKIPQLLLRPLECSTPPILQLTRLVGIFQCSSNQIHLLKKLTMMLLSKLSLVLVLLLKLRNSLKLNTVLLLLLPLLLLRKLSSGS